MVQRLTLSSIARAWRELCRSAALAFASTLFVGCATEQPAANRYPPPVQNRPAIPPSTPHPAPRPQPYPQPQTPQPVPQTPPPQQAERTTPKPQSTVTLALQDEAQRAANTGDYAKATQILERAIRIEPDRAELWLELARVHLKEGNAAQAEQFARKALLFTGNRYDLEQQAYVVIADAQKAER